MKKILITGADSYIGTSFETYLSRWPEEYQVDTVDLRSDDWKSKSFAGYDSVYHVAGIAHTKENKQNEELFYRVNRDLTLEVAKKAKAEGVRQFIFLSSMSVYGINEGAIDPYGIPTPESHYGKSKYQAEQGLDALRCDSFAVVILRPPMVYGYGCKGNYQYLIKFSKVVPFFPDYENKRSMCSVENLSKFVKEQIDSDSDGLFFPQDEEYACTCRMVQQLGAEMGRKIRLVKFLNPAVSLAKRCTSPGRKAFNDLYYEKKT